MLTNHQIELLVARIEPDLIALRRRIHAHPELAFEEHETARAVSGYLSAIDIPHRTGVGKTGVVAVIEGGAAGPTVGVRADMDALPIEEASAKVRVGPPVDDPADLDADVWAGTLALRTVAGAATPAPDLKPGLELPSYLDTFTRP